IQERKYVVQEERRLHPTELGKTVDTLLRQHFPDIVDVAFTADMEKRLDGIEEGQREYVPTIAEWYTPFAETIATAETTMERVKVPAKATGEMCPECGEGELVEREGRYGKFVGCSRYPDCKYIKGKDRSEPVPTGEMCPTCGKELVVRQGAAGRSSAAAAIRPAATSRATCRWWSPRETPTASRPTARLRRARCRWSRRTLAPVPSAASRWPDAAAGAGRSSAAPGTRAAATSRRAEPPRTPPERAAPAPPRRAPRPSRRERSAPTAASRWSSARAASAPS